MIPLDIGQNAQPTPANMTELLNQKYINLTGLLILLT